jgi:hypothetical protein
MPGITRISSTVAVGGGQIVPHGYTKPVLVHIGKTSLESRFIVADNLPFALIVGFTAQAALGLVTIANRANVYLWPLGTTTPVDSGIPLLRLPVPRGTQCLHNLYHEGRLDQPLELDAFGFGEAWLDLPSLTGMELDTPLHVLPGVEIALGDPPVKLMEGCASLKVRELDPLRR